MQRPAQRAVPYPQDMVLPGGSSPQAKQAGNAGNGLQRGAA
jgi:hypothetical protein